ncbi:hypothetical protein [Croceibacterium aestuarii]|uniref:hypothetical protein n=1 Tax=Croceibacterium aestuarii TaxID=3064139 RepID=UPI00272E1EFD|nr:hypothetical protein [Croceibacterium sp. D39]
MRKILALAALTACTAGSPPPSGGPVPTIERLEGPSAADSANCRDKVYRVREERGLPALDKKGADPAEPLFIAAVDKRIDGCAVLVMRNDTSDIRPLPEPEAPAMRPAQ